MVYVVEMRARAGEPAGRKGKASPLQLHVGGITFTLSYLPTCRTRLEFKRHLDIRSWEYGVSGHYLNERFAVAVVGLRAQGGTRGVPAASAFSVVAG
jgi:hypothetical protein